MSKSPKEYAKVIRNDTKVPVVLDETFAREETPKGILLPLYEHQKILLAALLSIENEKFVKTKDGIVIETSACRISDSFGSGKTLTALALIMRNRIPRALPRNINYVRAMSSKSDSKTDIIKRTQKLIEPTLIVVGPPVFHQWKKAIENFAPDLTYLEINTVIDLSKFLVKFRKNEINDYKIILVKNGNITVDFSDFYKNSPDGGQKIRSIITILGDMTQGYIWARIFYDDFDTSGIPYSAKHLDAFSTIFISATKKDDRRGNIQHLSARQTQNPFVEMVPFLEEISRPYVLDVLCDAHIMKTFDIRNNPGFIERSMNIPKYRIYRCLSDNPNIKYIELLGGMGEKEVDTIVEMLYADAQGEAAKALAINTNSVADIFQKVLGDKYAIYMASIKKIEYYNKSIQYIKDLEFHPDGAYKTQENHKILARIDKLKTLKHEFYTSSVEQYLNESLTIAIKEREENGKAIDRVRSNIREGGCQVCCLPLSDSDVIINKCCGVILCDECGIKSQNFTKHGRCWKTGDSGKIMGSCANCKRPINITTDIIFVTSELNIESLESARGDEITEVEPEKPEEVESSSFDEVANPKIRQLLTILQGKIPKDSNVIDKVIPSLVDGKKFIERKPEKKPKVAIFSNYDETLDNIQPTLAKFGFKFARLMGKAKELDNIISEFKENGDALLINSRQHCAGMNLQFITTLVIMHKINDENVESQVIGRGQRIGREDSLEVFCLNYRGEKD